jgi:hypothetical protein
MSVVLRRGLSCVLRPSVASSSVAMRLPVVGLSWSAAGSRSLSLATSRVAAPPVHALGCGCSRCSRPTIATESRVAVRPIAAALPTALPVRLFHSSAPARAEYEVPEAERSRRPTSPHLTIYKFPV